MDHASSQPSPSDAELVTRAQRLDRAASTELLLRYQDRVYNTCCRMCRNHADALDVTQSALLKALQALPRFEARSSFFTWLFRIVVNQVITHRRRSRPMVHDRRRGDDDEGRMEPAGRQDDADPSEMLEREEMHDRLRAALRRLDDEFRAAVVLKDVEELDYATIGEILNVPLGTVKSRIHRGRMMLRAMLEEVGDSHDGRR